MQNQLILSLVLQYVYAQKLMLVIQYLSYNIAMAGDTETGAPVSVMTVAESGASLSAKTNRLCHFEHCLRV